MAPARRVALVEWARRVRRSGSSRTTTTASSATTANRLARCRVSTRVVLVYGGTAQQARSPPVCTSRWLVLPPSLVEPVTESSRWRVGVSAIDQAALADFITTGHLDRHLRQMRVVYRRRRDEVIADAPDARTVDDHERRLGWPARDGAAGRSAESRARRARGGPTVIGRLPSVECPPRRGGPSGLGDRVQPTRGARVSRRASSASVSSCRRCPSRTPEQVATRATRAGRARRSAQ